MTLGYCNTSLEPPKYKKQKKQQQQQQQKAKAPESHLARSYDARTKL